MPAISFHEVSKAFASGKDTGQRAAVRSISMEIEEGEFVVLLGPSGCGKTTLMRMVNRLIEPTSGEIYVNGREIHQIAATELRRHIGYVIQQVGLFPHMTVAQNIAVVPRLLGWDKPRIAARTAELLDLVALPAGEYLGRYPRQLSGGQQQRIGIARAMAADPAVLLMDEPFGAIDAITRADLQDALLHIQRQVAKTVIFVTHDVEEALRLADRIAVMRAGELVQVDSPVDLLTRPADDFVRSLLGTEDVFRRLSLIPIQSVMGPPVNSDGEKSTAVGSDDVRSALSRMIREGATDLTVVDTAGKPIGSLTLARILAMGAQDENGAASTLGTG